MVLLYTVGLAGSFQHDGLLQSVLAASPGGKVNAVPVFRGVGGVVAGENQGSAGITLVNCIKCDLGSIAGKGDLLAGEGIGLNDLDGSRQCQVRFIGAKQRLRPNDGNGEVVNLLRQNPGYVGGDAICDGTGTIEMINNRIDGVFALTTAGAVGGAKVMWRDTVDLLLDLITTRAGQGSGTFLKALCTLRPADFIAVIVFSAVDTVIIFVGMTGGGEGDCSYKVTAITGSQPGTLFGAGGCGNDFRIINGPVTQRKRGFISRVVTQRALLDGYSHFGTSRIFDLLNVKCVITIDLVCKSTVGADVVYIIVDALLGAGSAASDTEAIFIVVSQRLDRLVIQSGASIGAGGNLETCFRASGLFDYRIYHEKTGLQMTALILIRPKWVICISRDD